VSPTHVIYLDEEFYPEYEVRKVDLDVDSLWNLVSVLGNREEIFSMALQWQQLDLFEKSETAFRRYLEIDPGFFGAHYNLANVLFHLGHYEEAEKEFKEAIMIKPSYTDARVNLGNLLRHLERIDEAEQEYREAIRSNPSHVFARSNLAGC
jgi:tetratricopeptide (TPR) repeat protein